MFHEQVRILTILQNYFITESAIEAIKNEDLQGAVSSLTSHANEEVKKLAEELKVKL